MKFSLFVVIFLLLANCSKTKTVLICGDHLCINKNEAEQYFQENLSLEVKVINKMVKNEIDLVELNLKENQNGEMNISILSKNNTKKKLKILSNEEITRIKSNIRNKNKEKKVSKKVIEKKNKIISKEKKINNEKKIFENKVNNRSKDVVDVCSILEKCNIEEITKYLLKQGKKKDFPDITRRQ